MRIICITGMYPTEKEPLGGVFISSRIEALRKNGIEVDAFAVGHSASRVMSWIRKKAGRPEKNCIEDGSLLPEQDSDIVYEAIAVTQSLLCYFLDKITSGKWSVRLASRKLLKRTKGTAYDLIHAHWLYPTGRVAEAYAEHHGIPSVVTCHGSDIHTEMADPRKRKSRLDALNAASKVEFVSNALYLKAREYGYDRDNYFVNPNGIDEIHHAPKEKNQNPVVGYVGNMIDVKQVMSFPQMFRRISESISNVEFHLVGDGALLDALKQELKDTKTIMHGRIAHKMVPAHMSGFDVMILPSKNEGWPCVVLEAHSCGIPVIGSDRGGIPEAIADDRLVVPEGDNFENRFADRVRDFLEGKIEVDSLALVERAKQYTWENLQRKDIQVYEDLAEWVK